MFSVWLLRKVSRSMSHMSYAEARKLYLSVHISVYFRAPVLSVHSTYTAASLTSSLFPLLQLVRDAPAMYAPDVSPSVWISSKQ